MPTLTVTETFRFSEYGYVYELTYVDGHIRIFDLRVKRAKNTEWEGVVSGDWKGPGEGQVFELRDLQWNYPKADNWPAILARVASILRRDVPS